MLVHEFFPPYFSCPLCRFSIFVFLPFSFIFSTLSRKWRPKLFVLELRHAIFYGILAIQSKKLQNCWRSLNKWSKVKTFEDNPRTTSGRWPFVFYSLHEKCYQKSRNNSTRQKDFSFIILKFRVQRYEDMWPKKVGKPWREKRRCTLHVGMVSKEFANFVLKDDRPANSPDVNTLETFWIIVDETTYKDPAPKTLDELRQRLRFA